MSPYARGAPGQLPSVLIR